MSSTRNHNPKSIDAADPSLSQSADYSYAYDAWPTLPSTQHSDYSYSRISNLCDCCGTTRLSWSTVSVLEILLCMTTAIVTLFFSRKYLLMILPEKTKLSPDVPEWVFCEWVVRMFGAMVVMQIVLLISGIVIGDIKTRKTIYWGILAGDLVLVAIYSAFVHNMSSWNPVNIATVVLASVFGLFRVIVLVLNPRWWVWAPISFLD